MRQPFIGLSLAAAAGVLVGDYFPAALPVAMALALLLLLAFLRWPRNFFVVLFVSIVFFCLHASRLRHSPSDVLRQAAGESPVAAEAAGEVMSEPKVESNGDATFFLRLSSISLNGSSIATTATVRVRWRGQAQVGDWLQLFGTLQPIAPPRNPGEFDMRAYLARRDVSQAFMVRSPENVRLVPPGSSLSLRRAASLARAWMQRTLSRDLADSPEAVSLICGTALGLRHQTPDDIEEPFQQTGTLHLFAVAGLHVGMVASLLWIVASVLRLPRKMATAAIIPLLFFTPPSLDCIPPACAPR